MDSSAYLKWTDLQPRQLKYVVSKAGFSLGEIFRAQRKAYCFSSNSAKSVRWKVGSSSTFQPRKIPQTNHIAHFAYHVIKTIAAPYGWFRRVENRFNRYLYINSLRKWLKFDASLVWIIMTKKL